MIMFGDLPKIRRPRRGGEGPIPVPHHEKVVLRRLSEDPDVVALRSLLSLAAASNQDQPITSHHTRENPEVHANASEQKEESELAGVKLEYETGVGLRVNVLEPVLNSSDVARASPAETTRLLGLNCRGESLFLSLEGSPNVVPQVSVQRITGEDTVMMTKWYNSDKYLPYTDQAWSDWWVQRCQLFDPGCEMYKLKTDMGNTFGVCYLERNILDRHEFGKKGRITLIRGLRVAPQFNPHVDRRKTLSSTRYFESGEATYTKILTLLFNHVVYLSLRYGSDAVSVNCPKILEFERFYESVMGPPLAFDQRGRRYYRIESQDRWKILRKAFRHQVEIRIDPPTNGGPTTGKRKISS